MRGKAGISGLLAPLLAGILGVAVLVGLGTWQLHRLDWKLGLIAAAQHGSTQAPEPIPPRSAWATLDPAAMEYRRVRLAGTFRHADEAHVFEALTEPKGRFGGLGSWVLTPLVLDDGGIVLVNRGFVPDDHRDPATRPGGQVAGRVEVVGLVRWSEPHYLFTPADDPARNRWFTRDVAAIADARHLGGVAPFYVEAERTPPGGLPQGGETRLSFTNNHLQYALTWYLLAAVLAAMVGWSVWRRLADGRMAGQRLVGPNRGQP